MHLTIDPSCIEFASDANKGSISSSSHRLRSVGCSLCLLINLVLINLLLVQTVSSFDPRIIESYFEDLYKKDTCGTIFTSKRHGYNILEYSVVTKDNYIITLHRLIHPSDFATNGPKPCEKKPFLMLHGLIGTSAGYVLNVEPNYMAPQTIYTGSRESVIRSLTDKSHQRFWVSSADNWSRRFEQDKHKMGDRSAFKMAEDYARLNEDIDFDIDPTEFGKEFKQGFKKFTVPDESKKFISNSLAFTLSNFGYDVWLINLRGNRYSRQYRNSRFGHSMAGEDDHDSAEYWDFDIETIIKQDLQATYDFIQSQAQCDDHPMGFVTYSYNCMSLLGLLSRDSKFQKMLQPIIMLAPTLLTPVPGRELLSMFMKTAKSFIISHNGPFPSLGRDDPSNHKGKSSLLPTVNFQEILCKLPVASKLCRLFELILHGQSKQVKSIKGLMSVGQTKQESRKQQLINQDSRCGQTSKKVLRQILDNLVKSLGTMVYDPEQGRRNKRELYRRSVMVVHSEADEVSSPEEVRKIRDGPLRNLALIDYVIKDKDFGHTDFLFAKENQYLVNAEVMRFVLLYDVMMYKKSANMSKEDKYRVSLSS